MTCARWNTSGPPAMADTPSPISIMQALNLWHSTRSRLLSEDTDLAHDEQLLTHLLGEECTDLTEIQSRLARAIMMADDMALVADKMGADLLTRRNRYKRRAAQYRATLLAIMEVIDRPRLELPEATAFVRPGPVAVVITDEEALAERFVRTKVIREPNKVALREALEDGEVIDGCHLTNGAPILTVRKV